MVEDKNGPDEPFLQRWARRKAEAAPATVDDAAPDTVAVETASLEDTPLAPAGAGEDAEASEIDLASLPDIDSLDESSDFSVFMQNGIPDALRTRALQRLWRLDPAFGHIDGLLDYGEDFTGTGLAAEAVNTIYKVGKGMLSDDEEEEAPPASIAGDDAEADAVTADATKPLPAPEFDADADRHVEETTEDADRTG